MAASSTDSKRVLVIGAGPSGLAAARFLREADQDVLILEAGKDYGGIWAREPTNNVVYDNLVTNLPKFCMQSFDLDFPEHLPSYLKAAHLGEYSCEYATKFGLRPLTKFGSRVMEIKASHRPVAEGSPKKRIVETAPTWRVSWNEDGVTVHDDFAAVVVATGHYEVPYLPEVPGQQEWLAALPDERRVTHARQYRNPQPFQGRSVLVVGGRSSGVDINREVHSVAPHLYSLEKGCCSPKTEGHATHVPLGAELRADGHVYFQGQQLPGPPVDDVILATGYTYSFPFLDEEALGLDFGRLRRYVAPLYQHVVHCGFPSLCFMGIPLSVPTPVPLFEAQARFVAAHLSGRLVTPQAEREDWVSRRFEAVGERSQDLHFMSSDSVPYMKELTKLSGMDGDAFADYCRCIDLVAALHRDRCERKPTRPWGDDSFRRYEYSVDWETGSWTVKPWDEPPVAPSS